MANSRAWQNVNCQQDSGTDSTDGVKEGPLQRVVLAAEIRSIRYKKSVGSFLSDFANSILDHEVDKECQESVTRETWEKHPGFAWQSHD